MRSTPISGAGMAEASLMSVALQDHGGAAVPAAELPARAVREGEVAVRHLHLRVRLAA